MREFLAIASLLIYSGVSFAWNSSDSVRAVGEGFKAYMDSEQEVQDKREMESEQIKRETEALEAQFEELDRLRKEKMRQANASRSGAREKVIDSMKEFNAYTEVLLHGKNLDNCISTKHLDGLQYNPKIKLDLGHYPMKGQKYTDCYSQLNLSGYVNFFSSDVFLKGERVAHFSVFAYPEEPETKKACYYDHGKINREMSSSDCKG